MKIYPVSASLISSNVSKYKKNERMLSNEIQKKEPSFKGGAGEKLLKAAGLIVGLPAIVLAGSIVAVGKAIDALSEDNKGDNGNGNGGSSGGDNGGSNNPSDPNSPDYTYPGEPFDTTPYKYDY